LRLGAKGDATPVPMIPPMIPQGKDELMPLITMSSVELLFVVTDMEVVDVIIEYGVTRLMLELVVLDLLKVLLR